MFETSPTIKSLMPALLKFQGAISGVKRDSANPHFRSRYVSLEGVIDAARPHLQDNGLVFTQAPGRVIDGCIEVTTRITHAESGEWQQSTMHIPMAKKDPQGAGSALTYAQRYSLMAALGLPPTDDDAETAYDRRDERPKPQASRNDRNAVIADTMIEAARLASDTGALKAWKEGQKEEIAALDEVNRKRVTTALTDFWNALSAAENLRAG